MYYLEYYHEKRYVIGARNEELINIWVSYIYQGIIYAHFLEDKLAEENENQVHQDISEEMKEIKQEMNKKSKIIRLRGEDIEKEAKDKNSKNTKFEITKKNLFTKKKN